MHLSLSIRIAVLVLSLLSVFWFPWVITLVLFFLSGLVFPPATIALGILADLLYYPGTGILWGTVEGLLLAILALIVRHFVKTRIM